MSCYRNPYLEVNKTDCACWIWLKPQQAHQISTYLSSDKWENTYNYFPDRQTHLQRLVSRTFLGHWLAVVPMMCEAGHEMWNWKLLAVIGSRDSRKCAASSLPHHPLRNCSTRETHDVGPMLVYCWASVCVASPTLNQHRSNVTWLPAFGWVVIA